MGRSMPGWGFWGLWVVASAIGWGGGWAAAWATGGAVAEDISSLVDVATTSFVMRQLATRTLTGAIIGLVLGASVGVAEWSVLRLRTRRTGWWVLATTVGLMAGWVAAQPVGTAIAGYLQQAIGWPTGKTGIQALVGSVAGALIGLVQWPALRLWVRRAAAWWVVISSLAGALTWTVVTAAVWDDRWIIAWATGGAAAATILGAVLLWLLPPHIRLSDLAANK